MPAPSTKSLAAQRREAAKRGEILPAPALAPDPSLASDPTYVMAVEGPTLSENAVVLESGGSTRNKRRHIDVDADIKFPQKPIAQAASSRSTLYRNRTGQTKKARAAQSQSSINLFFSSGPSQKKIRLAELSKDEEEEGSSDDGPIAMAPMVSSNELTRDSSLGAVTDVLMTVNEATQTLDDSTPTDDVVDEPMNALNEALDERISVLNKMIEEHDNFFNEVGMAGMDVVEVEGTDWSSNGVDEPQASALDNAESEHISDKPDNLNAPAAIPSIAIPLPAATQHQRLKRIVEVHRKKLRQGNAALTDTTAANSIILLESINQYNDLRLELTNTRDDLRKRIPNAPRSVKGRLRERMAKIRPSTDASHFVAGRAGKGPFFAKSIRTAAHKLLETGSLPEKHQGQGASHQSLLLIPGIASAVQHWTKGGLDYEEGGFNGRMRPAKLQRYVNHFLLPELKIEDTISEATAVRWLKAVGFKLCRIQKGVYVDGHERSDVIASRTEFLNFMFTQVLPFAYAYEGPDLVEIEPELQANEKIHYPIFHDETCIHANDLANYVWQREGEPDLRSKSRGRIIHVSDFIIEHCGWLRLNEEEILAQMKLRKRPTATQLSVNPDHDAGSSTADVMPVPTGSKPKKVPRKKNTRKSTTTEGRTFAEQEGEWPRAPTDSYRIPSFDARRIIYPGANYDAWWDMPQLIAQTKDAIEIFNVKYPNGIAVFIFDCSSAHEAYPADALLAHRMNRGPGGKQPFMRNTVIPSTNQPQSMVFSADYKGTDKNGVSLAGKQKGMEQVLSERGLLAALEEKHGAGRLLGICSDCKKSEAARDAALKLAKSKADEIEGDVEASLNSRGISALEDEDLGRAKDCCMQRVLSLEKDFREEKPLLQLGGERRLFLFDPIK